VESKNLKDMSLDELKQKATLLGVAYKGNISKEKLSALIEEVSKERNEAVGVKLVDPYEEPVEDPDYIEAFDAVNKIKPKKSEIDELRYQALLMLKVRITNLNPEESDSPTVYAGVVTPYVRAARYIPFDRVWYVEQCLVDKLLTDKIQVFVNEIDPRTNRPNGNKKPKLVKHYNVEFVK
jgi:hypothetical protein